MEQKTEKKRKPKKVTIDRVENGYFIYEDSLPPAYQREFFVAIDIQGALGVLKTFLEKMESKEE